MPETNVSPPYTKDPVDVENDEDPVSLSSDATQTGVKNIEIVSQTWTQSSLIAAYLGYVLPLQLRLSFEKERADDGVESLIKILGQHSSYTTISWKLNAAQDHLIA